jgi:DNA-binding transcriptional regulator GbsR (MarR family)
MIVLSEAKRLFINRWGEISPNWGISKAMGQIHALLLISEDALCHDQIMKALRISRGNVHNHITQLMEWNLIGKKSIAGSRKEYYFAEKDLKKIIKHIILVRKKRELEPLQKLVDECKMVADGSPQNETFNQVLDDINLYSTKADKLLTKVLEIESTWLGNLIQRI